MEGDTSKDREGQPEEKRTQVCKSSNKDRDGQPEEETTKVYKSSNKVKFESQSLVHMEKLPVPAPQTSAQDHIDYSIEGTSGIASLVGNQQDRFTLSDKAHIGNVVSNPRANVINVINVQTQPESGFSSENNDEVIRKYLLCRQHKLCCNANRFTPETLNTRYQVDISHMFTDLDLLKENKKKQKSKSTTLEEVLDIIKSTPACNVLIDGEGGIGKTTLLRYLAYNWANESDETFKGKIVFPVDIRDIVKGKTIVDTILKQMDLEDFPFKTNLQGDPDFLIKRFIMNHDDEIVLLLDGLDELRDGSESPIRFFKKEKMGNSMVILTSRSENIDEFIKESSVHVKVKGFNADNIRKYIKKHFDYFDEPAKGDSLIRELQLDDYKWHWGDKHKEVYSMCKNPMLLLSICIMWEDSQHFPADKTDLFKEFFCCILNQFNKRAANNQKISTFEDTPKKYVNAMLLLGKCMYEGLKRNQLYINKKHLEGNEEMVAMALKLGFVYKDASHLKADFEEIFSAPHKLIVESLVGFYLFKLCQTEGLEKEGTEGMEMLLKPLDDNEWEMIRESKYLKTAREFVVGFIGANAGKFLNRWITNSFLTYRSLMTYIKLVKEEHRTTVEKTLIDDITKKEEIKPHIDDICKSLRGFIHQINPSVEVNENDNFIQLLSRVDDNPCVLQLLLSSLQNNSFCKDKSSEEKCRMLAHILIAVPEQQTILEVINGVFADDDLKYLTDESQKLNFKYDIRNYEVKNTSISTSYLAHLLINSSELVNLCFCRVTCEMSDLIRECSSRGVKLQLCNLTITESNLSNIDGSSLASLLVIAPQLQYLQIVNCTLSDVIMNDMMRGCSSRGVKLQLMELNISGNHLSNIDGSSLVSLLVIAPELIALDISNCSLSGVIMIDMTRECSSRGVKLKLMKLFISGNNLSKIDGSSLVSFLVIAPNLIVLDISNCSLSGVIMNDMTKECSNRGVDLHLLNLKIGRNNLSNIDGSSLASLLVIAPNLMVLDISNCSLSGVIMNDMTRECSSRGVKLQLIELFVSGNNLSNIDGSSLVSLLDIAPELISLAISNCRISGVVMNDMTRECSDRGVELPLSWFFL